jgi:Calcineurin-like phosphoesterase
VLTFTTHSYARGYDVQWDEFMDQIAPVAARVPWMVAAGNHERDAPYASLNKKTRNKPSYYKGWDSGTHFKTLIRVANVVVA